MISPAWSTTKSTLFLHIRYEITFEKQIPYKSCCDWIRGSVFFDIFLSVREIEGFEPLFSKKSFHACLWPVKSNRMMCITGNIFPIVNHFKCHYCNFLRSTLHVISLFGECTIWAPIVGKSTFGPIWARHGPKTLKLFILIFSIVASNRCKMQTKDL